MTSSFDNLPQEPLCRIIHYIADSKHDLRQIQLLNKRFQAIAEAHLYEVLTLSRPSKLSYLHFVLKPKRCKLVKILQIEQEYIATIDENLIMMFPNIQRIRTISKYPLLNWEHFGKIFSSKSYKLKQVPALHTDKVKGCVEMIRSHHQTLESLDFGNVDYPKATGIIQCVNSTRWMFPKVKNIYISGMIEGTLQDLDIFIDKCPLLEDLNVKYIGNNGGLSSWHPNVQHQHLMKSVCVNSPCSGFLNVCNYFLGKFPNVQKWDISTTSMLFMEKEDQPVSIEEAIDFLSSSSLLTKPEAWSFKFITKRSSLPKALEHFSGSDVYKVVRIVYEFSDVLDKDRPLVVNARNSSIAYIEINNNGATSNDQFCIKYLPIGLGHINLLESAGSHIQNLFLDIGCNFYTEVRFTPMTPRDDDMLRGGIVSHILRNCPALMSLQVRINNIKFINSDVVHTNLETMSIATKEIPEELLAILSYIAPNVKDFEVKANFPALDKGRDDDRDEDSDEYTDVDSDDEDSDEDSNEDSDDDKDDDRKDIIINMPFNSFDTLKICDVFYELSLPLSDYIIVYINLLTRPTTKYCFKKYTMEKIEGQKTKEWKFEEQTYSDDHVNLLSAYTKVVITCTSIKFLKFSSNAKDLIFKAIE